MNHADFFEGECTACLSKVYVRQHSNLYINGSEGSLLCRDCERQIILFMQAKRRRLSQLKVERIKKEKESNPK
jgi:hypothetical protein